VSRLFIGPFFAPSRTLHAVTNRLLSVSFSREGDINGSPLSFLPLRRRLPLVSAALQGYSRLPPLITPETPFSSVFFAILRLESFPWHGRLSNTGDGFASPVRFSSHFSEISLLPPVFF